jgi:hypothetical protein
VYEGEGPVLVGDCQLGGGYLSMYWGRLTRKDICAFMMPGARGPRGRTSSAISSSALPLDSCQVCAFGELDVCWRYKPEPVRSQMDMVEVVSMLSRR